MQIILVHTFTKFYCSNPSCCQEIQGDAKLHHHPRMGCLEKPRNRFKAIVPSWNYFLLLMNISSTFKTLSVKGRQSDMFRRWIYGGILANICWFRSIFFYKFDLFTKVDKVWHEERDQRVIFWVTYFWMNFSRFKSFLTKISL